MWSGTRRHLNRNRTDFSRLWLAWLHAPRQAEPFQQSANSCSFLLDGGKPSFQPVDTSTEPKHETGKRDPACEDRDENGDECRRHGLNVARTHAGRGSRRALQTQDMAPYLEVGPSIRASMAGRMPSAVVPIFSSQVSCGSWISGQPECRIYSPVRPENLSFDHDGIPVPHDFRRRSTRRAVQPRGRD